MHLEQLLNLPIFFVTLLVPDLAPLEYAIVSSYLQASKGDIAKVRSRNCLDLEASTTISEQMFSHALSAFSTVQAQTPMFAPRSVNPTSCHGATPELRTKQTTWDQVPSVPLANDISSASVQSERWLSHDL